MQSVKMPTTCLCAALCWDLFKVFKSQPCICVLHRDGVFSKCSNVNHASVGCTVMVFVQSLQIQPCVCVV